MRPEDRFEERPDLWRPAAGEAPELDLDNPSQLSFAILNVARLSEAEVTRVVDHLVAIGQPYQAARCLEIVAQQQLGLDFTGHELIDQGRPGFGLFHHWIHDMLRAGTLYHRAKRPGTADAAYRRALIFVEEALRSLPSYSSDSNSQMWGVGLAFELAGHCCVALDDTNGLEYYQAAERFWSRALRLRPEAISQWTHHPVTRTVINCLSPAVERRALDEERLEQLLTSDYQTRLDTAMSLLR
ncbi:hypothetical protein D3C86_960080 [compost metagenome]